MNPFGAKDLAAPTATLSLVAPPAREPLIATAAHYQSEIRKDLAEYVFAAPLAADVIDTVITAGNLTHRTLE